MDNDTTGDVPSLLTCLNDNQIAALIVDSQGYLVAHNAQCHLVYALDENARINFFDWCDHVNVPTPITRDDLMQTAPVRSLLHHPNIEVSLHWLAINQFDGADSLLMGSRSPIESVLLSALLKGYQEEQVLNAHVKGLATDTIGQSIGDDLSTRNYLDETVYYLETIIDQLPVSVYWKSVDNTYVRGNRIAASLVNLPSGKAFMGKRDEEFAKALDWLPEVVNTFTQQNKQVLSGEPIVNFEEKPFQNPDGDTVYQLTNRVPLCNKQGDITGVLGVSVDITERSMLAKERLEKKVLKATVAENEKVLNRLFQFTQNQEHDIRTAMTGVVMAAESLQKAQEKGFSFNDEIVTTILDAMVVSSRQILDYQESLLSDLYDDESRGRNVFTRFDLKAITQSVFDLHQSAAQSKQLTYTYQFDETIPQYLRGDARKTYQCLMDLLGNAIKFTDTGTVALSVTCLGEQEGCAHVRFMVSDTGMGIPEDKQRDIFQAYVKLKPSNRGQSPGRGMGLTRVANYAESIHGELNFESEVGQGSVFRLVLPFAISLDQTDD